MLTKASWATLNHTMSESKGKQVYVGLSGGVDSAVSAALLKRSKYDVTAVFVRINLPDYPCSVNEDRRDALRVATHLDIPFLDVDLSSAYKDKVFKPTINEFRQGKTPNPDTLCNKEIKFGLLYKFIKDRGGEFLATGHYAQVAQEGKHTLLYKGIDENKDQSYFLWDVPEKNLANVLFPIGKYTKPSVRALARTFRLHNADRKDSQGLCFLGNISMEDMLQRELSLIPGDVLTPGGDIIGRHRGTPLYTLGQRHGFELSVHTPHGRPHFVVAKDIKNNTITVSEESKENGGVYTYLTLVGENWIGPIPRGPCTARFRYRQTLIPATLTFTGNKTVGVLEGAHVVPEGQSLVFYESNRCVGGGGVDKVSFTR